MSDRKRLASGKRKDAKFGFDDACERAFTAAKNRGPAFLPGIPAMEGVTWPAFENGARFPGFQIPTSAPELSIEPPGCVRKGNLVVVHPGQLAVKSGNGEAVEMVGSGAVTRDAGSRGVVADHAANSGAGTGRHVGTKHELVGAEELVELIEDDPGTDRHDPALPIEVPNLIVVAGEIDNEPRAKGPAHEAGSRAPGGDRDLRPGGDFKESGRLAGVLGKRHSLGKNLIDGTVGGVELAGHRVIGDFNAR